MQPAQPKHTPPGTGPASSGETPASKPRKPPKLTGAAAKVQRQQPRVDAEEPGANDVPLSRKQRERAQAEHARRVKQDWEERQKANEPPPPIPPVNLDMIPQEMRQFGHLVLWRREFDPEAEDPRKRWRKVPVIAGTTIRASSTNPATWRSWAVTVTAYAQAVASQPDRVGLGYVFSKAC